MIEDIYILLIFAGLTIITVLFYLRRLANKTLKVILEIIELHTSLSNDTDDFPCRAFEKLKSVGISDYSYRIEYFDSIRERKKNVSGKGISKSYKDDDSSIFIEIIPESIGGENRYVSLIILEVIFLLIKSNVLIKTKSIHETFSNISKVQTYIIHDVKNIAQFIQACSYNMKKAKTAEEEHRLFMYLKDSLSALQLRADRIIGALEINAQTKTDNSFELDIRSTIEDLLNIYKLDSKVSGKALFYGDSGTLITVLDNLIKNIYDKSMSESLDSSVEISQDNEMIRIIISDTGKQIDSLDRIFEPFYTTKQGGMGLGLFYVRKTVKNIGGSITVGNTDKGVFFALNIPRSANTSYIHE